MAERMTDTLTPLSERYADRIAAAFAKYPDKRSAVMPLLFFAQEAYGYLTPESLREVAALCDMDPTQVQSIAGFYTMYRERPKGQYWLQVCTDLPCALNGADAFYRKLQEYLGIHEEGGTSADSLFTLEHVMCLAACDKAPMLQCNFRYMEALDMAKMKVIHRGEAGGAGTRGGEWRGGGGKRMMTAQANGHPSILLRHREIKNYADYGVYCQHGGYQTYRQAVAMEPSAIIDEVKASGLRGRGGAGFPTGVKWSFIPPSEPLTYVVVNADESETGTFKDREIMEGNPHQLLEGSLICARAIRAKAVYIYLRGEFWDIADALDERIAQLYAEGLAGKNILGSGWDCDVFTHLGAGAYICGEESALLESLEGKLGMPRVRPPFPAQKGGGLYYEPTVVNNVETLANVPWIMERGAAAFRAIGTEQSSGTKVFCVSGHVQRPGNYELALGTPLRELLYDCAGGPPDGRQFKAVLPSGGSGPLIPTTEEILDTPLSYEGVRGGGDDFGLRFRRRDG